MKLQIFFWLMCYAQRTLSTVELENLLDDSAIPVHASVFLNIYGIYIRRLQMFCKRIHIIIVLYICFIHILSTCRIVL